MKRAALYMCVGGLAVQMAASGCSFSASASAQAGGKRVVHGDEAIVVEATQPAAPASKPPVVPKIVKPTLLKAKIVGKKIEISEKVMFDYNKASIKVESHDLLGDVAKVIKEHKNIDKIRIEGHTDADGDAKYNKKLSQKRADAVKSFLVKAGIDGSKLKAVGYGEDKPVASNETEEGKEKNRRVEFNIID